MNRYNEKRGFTLVELSVSALVVSLIFLVLIMIFRGNLQTWQWGQKHMEFNQRVQLVMKQMFTDFKQINPILVTDSDGHIWVQGEKGGDIQPNLVTIYDHEPETSAGGQELVFFLTSLNDPSRRDRVRYHINEKGELVREVQDYHGNPRARVIAKKAADLVFRNDPGDNRQIKTSVTITDDENPDMVETVDFAVRLETDLVSVKMVRTYE